MIENKAYLSVVSPVYLAEGIIDELVKRITEEVSKKSKETSGLFKKAYILFLLFKYVPLFCEKEKTFDSVLK